MNLQTQSPLEFSQRMGSLNIFNVNILCDIKQAAEVKWKIIVSISHYQLSICTLLRALNLVILSGCTHGNSVHAKTRSHWREVV